MAGAPAAAKARQPRRRRAAAGAPLGLGLLLLVLLLVVLHHAAQAFVLPSPAHRTLSSPLWRRAAKPSLLPRSSSSSVPSTPTTRPDLSGGGAPPHSHQQQQHEHQAVVDSHWLQGDVIASLRAGEIPAFSWPHCDVDVSTGVGVTPVDKAALKAARARLRSVPAVWEALAAACPDNAMLVDPSHAVGQEKKGKGLTLSFKQVNNLVQQAAAGLHALGLRKGDHVAFFSENSARWLLMEQGCARNGCPTAVRGATAPLDELQYIYDQSDSRAVVLQDVALLRRLKDAGWLASAAHGAPRLVVLVRPPEGGQEELAALSSELGGVPVVAVEEVLALGAKHRPHYRAPELHPHDLVTLVYTSGTTGMPKGVMLTHGNLLHQINHISLDDSDRRNPGAGDVVLSLLPCWHIFERSAELFALSRGAALVYSSVRAFKADLAAYRPHFLIVVPRLLENVHKSIKDKFASGPPARRRLVAMLSAVCVLYHKALKRAKGLVVKRPRFPLKLKHNPFARLLALVTVPLLWPLAAVADALVWRKVRAALGGRSKLIISGGSALPKFLERFYEAAGIHIVSGYGLTETSPVIAVRRADKNLVDGGVVGLPPKEVELQIRDPETHAPLPPGRPGVVFTRGPQVMLGYYKEGAATAKVLDADGWFETGDLGLINPGTGDLVLTGRAKDIIVLSNGENVEPTPIEDAILERCPSVEQVMLVGQDQRFLGALVVVSPKGLAERGLLPKDEADRLEALVGPTAALTGCVASPKELAAEAAKLTANSALVRAVEAEVAAALSSPAGEDEEGDEPAFRPYEVVKKVHLALEPFSVANGLLTQTLKVKRNVVAERFAKEVAGLYT